MYRDDVELQRNPMELVRIKGSDEAAEETSKPHRRASSSASSRSSTALFGRWLLVCISFGLRISECLALKWSRRGLAQCEAHRGARHCPASGRRRENRILRARHEHRSRNARGAQNLAAGNAVLPPTATGSFASPLEAGPPALVLSVGVAGLHRRRQGMRASAVSARTRCVTATVRGWMPWVRRWPCNRSSCVTPRSRQP
jgi:hypothetical protein